MSKMNLSEEDVRDIIKCLSDYDTIVTEILSTDSTDNKAIDEAIRRHDIIDCLIDKLRI